MAIDLRQNQWQLAVTLAGANDCFDAALLNSTVAQKSIDAMAPIAALIERHDLAIDVAELEQFDWWFQTELPATTAPLKSRRLKLTNLATIADVWLDNEKVLRSENMFLEHCIPVAASERAVVLTICIRGLQPLLDAKHPRPRWKTKLVANQTLRWVRTSLFGRIPGWTPTVCRAGLLGSIDLIEPYELSNYQVQTELKHSAARIQFNAQLDGAEIPNSAHLVLGDQVLKCQLASDNGECEISVDAAVENVSPWWPHTHGKPQLYPLSLALSFASGEHTITLTPVGFRQLAVATEQDNFQVVINQQPIFCRGACWTTCDLELAGENDVQLYQQLMMLQASGANMVRVIGTTEYQNDRFYQICDQLGLMVWQDFMFANMDYPVADEAFAQSIAQEAQQQLKRLAKHPSIVIYCGNSEVLQQVRMLGFDETVGKNDWFDTQLPALVTSLHNNVHYVPSTPYGGAMPFHLNRGVTHYYGIGAYRRPLSELRSHDVRFAAETLGFSHIPSQKVIKSMFGNELAVVHDPRWKAGTPRDSGTGWDFDDIRDHYFQELFKSSALEQRYVDPERYMQLSELVSGEVVARVFNEWRSSANNCSGALTWFFQDIKLGAGWGIIDGLAQTKAAYYFLKRAWQPLFVGLTNENFQGVNAEVHNERDCDFNGHLDIRLIDQHDQVIAHESIALTIAKRKSETFNLDAVLGHFFDLAYVYKFGPKNIKAIATTLFEDEQVVADNHYFPNELPVAYCDCELTIETHTIDPENLTITLLSNKLLYGVKVEVPGFFPSDNFFTLTPGMAKTIFLQQQEEVPRRKGVITAPALNEAKRIKF